MSEPKKLDLPLRAQPESRWGEASELRPHVEHEFQPHEIELLDRLWVKAKDGDQEALNEILVLQEVKHFFGDGAHIATPEEERDLPEFPAEPPAAEPEYEQTTLISPELAETTLPLPAAIRDRLREQARTDQEIGP